MLSSVVIRVIIFLQSGTFLSHELFNVMENIARAFCALAKLLDDLRCPIPPVNRSRLLGAQKVSGDGSVSFTSWNRDTELQLFKLLMNFYLAR